MAFFECDSTTSYNDKQYKAEQYNKLQNMPVKEPDNLEQSDLSLIVSRLSSDIEYFNNVNRTLINTLAPLINFNILQDAPTPSNGKVFTKDNTSSLILQLSEIEINLKQNINELYMLIDKLTL